MLEILAITGPIFILIAVGYGAVRSGFMAKPDIRVLGFFVINFCVPAMLFRALSQRSLGEIVNVSYLLAYALGALAVIATSIVAVTLIQKKGLQSGVVQGMGMSVSNSTYIGFPVAAQVVGPIASVALALTVIIDTLLILPLLMILADAGSARRESLANLIRALPGRVLANPLIVAILAGGACAALEIRVPGPIAKAVELLAAPSSPIALFVVGGTLVGVNAKGVAVDISQIMAGKLLLHPLAVFAAFRLLPAIDHGLQLAAVLFASVPMLSIYPILGQKYGKEDICTAALVVTTVASFFTISAVVWLIGPGVTLRPT